MQDEFGEQPLRATRAGPNDDAGRAAALDEIRALEAGLTEKIAAARHRERAADVAATGASREPKDLYHSIALGAVLTGCGLRATDARLLDGLLDGTVEAFEACLELAVRATPGEKMGAVLVRIIDDNWPVLEAKGRMAAWRRKFDRYCEEHASWVALDREHRENGAWRTRPVSASQAALIRVTAGLLGIDIPGHLDRGHAHDWLQAKGANLRYRRVPS